VIKYERFVGHVPGVGTKETGMLIAVPPKVYV
jgi:hypothetical protein